MRHFATTAFLLLALFATACSSDTSPAGPSPAGSSATDAEHSSPLAALLGLPGSDEATQQEYFNNLSREAERKIATCMLAQGFQYTPVDTSELDSVGEGIDFNSRTFAEQYGFGIASNPFEESFEAATLATDPNATYVGSLSDGERQAYDTALHGALPDIDDSSEFFEPEGCAGEAFDETYAFARVLEQFDNEFSQLEEQFDADPRIVEARAGWSACMTGAGYRYADEKGATAEIKRRYDAIVNDPDAAVDIDAYLEEQLESGSDQEVFMFGPRTLKPEYQTQVDELAEEERALAAASWDCNEPLREIEETVRLEYDQQFVDQNGAAIQAALAG